MTGGVRSTAGANWLAVPQKRRGPVAPLLTPVTSPPFVEHPGRWRARRGPCRV